MRPTSNVYGINLAANTTLAPLQLVPTTNELSNFISLLNTTTGPVLVRLENQNQNTVLALPTSGNSAEGFILPGNMIYPVVYPAPTPNVWLQAIGSVAGLIYAQLLQNH